MRRIGLGLLFFIGLFFSYLVWSYVTNQSSHTAIIPTSQKENYGLKVPSVLGGQKLSSSNKTIQNSKENFFDSGKKKIDMAKSFIEKIPETANRIFNDLIDQTKNITREKIDAILETSTLREVGAPTVSVGATSSPASSPTSPNTASSNNPSQNSSTELRVCSIISKGTLVDYSIDQPFPNTEEASYKIIWGDGKTINGSFHNGDQRIIVSHTYLQQGAYSIMFQTISSSTTLTVSRSICVRG